MTSSNVKSKDATKKGGILSFLKGVKAEVGIITWPSKNHAKKAFIAVALFTLIYAVLVSGVDYIFQHLFEIILNLKK